jgi:ABC-2 type transport system ATP-binding protein
MVKVSNVTKIYGKQHALDNVSFEVNKGEIVGFLGPNGAGKSTMMKIITCYIPATQGVISVEGFDTLEQSIEVRRQVGYLPEHNPLYLDMYVKEYLSFVAGLHLPDAQIKKRVDEMIELTGLTMEMKKKIGALSKGYRQRVGLAQAMIHNPKVLILDEPTSGLDPNQLIEIRALIKNLGKEKTVILSTHIMQEVTAICNRVIIINKGKIVADDTSEILQQKTSADTAVLVEFGKEVNTNDLKKIEGVTKVESLGQNKFRIHSDDDVRNAIFQFAVSNNNSVLSLQKEERNLEDVFHELTKG